MEKYKNEQGQIGVIVSGGFGAGWSTWNDNEEFLAMDKTLVEMKLNEVGSDIVQEYCEKTTGNSPYMGGWGKAEVEFVEEGERFTIEEYDGSESLRTLDDFNFSA